MSCVAIVCSILMAVKIPLCDCSTIYCWWIFGLFLFCFLLLYTVPLLIFLYMSFGRYMYIPLLTIHPGVEVLNHRGSVCSAVVGSAQDFQSSCINLHFHQQCMSVLVALYDHQHVVFSLYF